MRGYGKAYGAVSIVNAISIGKGAALGINLFTEAEVKINSEGRVKLANSKRDPSLAVEVIRTISTRLEIRKVGAEITTSSNIPEAVGLKSSSSAAVAISLAFLDALGINLTDEEILKLVAEASRRSGVSITGAIDDAAACMLGGAVVTDNREDKILRHEKISEDLSTLLLIPDKRIYTKDFNRRLLEPIRELVEVAFSLAIQGDYWRALTINGILHALALSLDTKPIIELLNKGALAAGVSGTGPAICAVVNRDYVEEIAKGIASFSGRIMIVNINNSHAVVGRCENQVD